MNSPVIIAGALTIFLLGPCPLGLHPGDGVALGHYNSSGASRLIWLMGQRGRGGARFHREEKKNPLKHLFVSLDHYFSLLLIMFTK